MSRSKIRAAFEIALNDMAPPLATAFENELFTKPDAGTPYQECWLLAGRPDNSSLGSAHYIDIGVFQISVKYPLGDSSGPADQRAELIATRFKRGTTLSSGGVNVLITRTPHIGIGRKQDDCYRLDISISYQADIFP